MVIIASVSCSGVVFMRVVADILAYIETRIFYYVIFLSDNTVIQEKCRV